MRLMPQEIEVRYILPTIRKEFAFELSRKNISQKEIAKILQLTPAAVSMYLNEKRALNVSLSKKNKDEIKKSVKKILVRYEGKYLKIAAYGVERNGISLII